MAKPPDYNVGAVVRGTDEKGTIGVAWKSDKDDGRISVKLHGFVMLRASPDLFITLFPRDAEPRGSATTSRHKNAAHNDHDIGDDMPF